MTSMAHLWLTNILRLIYPQKCCHCQTGGPYLCRVCYELLYYYGSSLHLPTTHPDLNSITAAVAFESPITRVIHAFKYQSVIGIGEWCAQLLYFSTNPVDVDALVPVPISQQRYRERGFNQAVEIALHLGRLLQLPVMPLLTRTKHLSAQASVEDRNQRSRRLADCFAIAPISSSLPKRVLLIDDVVTTGSTLKECARVLKSAGVTEVHALTVAHGS